MYTDYAYVLQGPPGNEGDIGRSGRPGLKV